jgi:hypothetical protein
MAGRTSASAQAAVQMPRASATVTGAAAQLSICLLLVASARLKTAKSRADSSDRSR